MLEPEGVFISNATGELSSSTGRYTKRLSELRAIYSDKLALQRTVEDQGDPVAYEVVEYRKEGSDIFFGTTIMHPGTVAGEFYMTRGHFHERRDMGEIYYTQSGHGLLLLESRDGHTREVEMNPGVCAFIPPDWAHRSVNIGTEKLVFVWCCNQAAGHDYGDILRRGMRNRVFQAPGSFAVVKSPEYE
ncbi:glucose-6-phosphate isomerase [Devosia sp. UYZn731]|uniref:glucose-6-phosphate isomerase family protein n=1 Tax=Devosia sp. UYZn731 TaxID=3156345 RepID=UPI00339B3F3F